MEGVLSDKEQRMTKILLVEDDPILGQGLKVNLELAGFAVNWCPNLRTARQHVKENANDVAVLDLGLPDGSGLELLQELRIEGSNLPM